MKFYIKLWWLALAVLLLIAILLLTPLPSVKPAEAVQSPVLIIDAGHGGRDGGAVAPDGMLESELNLDIALRLEALSVFWGVDTVMTRRTSEIDYPPEAATLAAMKKADQNARLELINTTPEGVLLSIHQNIYPAAPPRGIQVFYGSAAGSQDFASLLQTNLTGQLLPENRRIAEPISEDIYLLRKARCRAVLVECGFLSNPEDLRNLESGVYRTKLSVVMLASYLQYIRGLTV